MKKPPYISISKTALLWAVLLTASALHAKTIHVDAKGKAEHPTGESWSSAFTSLQEAIDLAGTDGGDIWVKSGIYKPEGAGRTNSFHLKAGVRLFGGFRGKETELSQRNPKANRTVLSGDIGRISTREDNAYHVVQAAGDTVLDGFIVTGGNANGEELNGFGGGILLEANSENILLANCTFERNNAVNGGAFYPAVSKAALTNCMFYSNSAERGGALYIPPQSSALIEDCVFSSNYSEKSGAAVHIGRVSTTLFKRCSFLFNATDGDGGGIYAMCTTKDALILECTECQFTENSARESGGALFNRGPFSPKFVQCRFVRNLSDKGAGAIANVEGVTVRIRDCSYLTNRGLKGMENIGTDESSSVSKIVAAVEPVPEKPKPMRKMADVYIHDSTGGRVSLRGIIQRNDYTVLAVGDLTDPGFVTGYRNIEAAALDYRDQGVGFFHIYTYLAHPENNRYIQPFQLHERARHIMVAKNLLHTRIEWLCDGMDNQTAAFLLDKGNNVFIYNSEGTELYAGDITDGDGFRKALQDAAGPVDPVTDPETLAKPDIEPVGLLERKLVEPVDIDPRKETFIPLKLEATDTRTPFYVKLRIEANSELLESGDGRLYLGFHLDPIYPVEWNNLGETVSYRMAVPSGMAISPSVNKAQKITERPVDREPREFMLEARKWKHDTPIGITVNYTVYSSASRRNEEVTQRYVIHLKQDHFGGQVLGRQTLKTANKQVAAKESNDLGSRFDNMLRNKDLNLDGKLSRDEAPRFLMDNWEEADTDSNGFVDKQEYIRFQQMRMP